MVERILDIAMFISIPLASGSVALAFDPETANNGIRSILPSRAEVPQSVFSLFPSHLDCCRALSHRCP